MSMTQTQTAPEAIRLSAIPIERLVHKPRVRISWRNELALLDSSNGCMNLLDGAVIELETELLLGEIVSRAAMHGNSAPRLHLCGTGMIEVSLFTRNENNEPERLGRQGIQLAPGGVEMDLMAEVAPGAALFPNRRFWMALRSFGDAELTSLQIAPQAPGPELSPDALAYLDLASESVARYPLRSEVTGAMALDRSSQELVLPAGTSVTVDTRVPLARHMLETSHSGLAGLFARVSGSGVVAVRLRVMPADPTAPITLFEDRLSLTATGTDIFPQEAETALLDGSFVSGIMELKVTALEDSRVTDIEVGKKSPDTKIAPKVLQNLVFPDTEICNEPPLFVHLNDRAFLRLGHDGVILMKGGVAVFDTYFNLFNLGNWLRNCWLDDLELVLRGHGRVSVHVWMAAPQGMEGIIAFDDIVTLSENGTGIDLSALLLEKAPQAAGAGVVMFKITALEEAELTGGAFRTRTEGGELPKLAVSITTFGREEEVAGTARKLARFMDEFEHGDRIGVFIVDNGKSAKIEPHPRLKHVPNENLGGAGGFARGLAEAQADDYTHCLFMDDDASFLLESFARTYSFLRFARDPKTAVCGSMISNARKWAMWENGAVFDKHCRPQFVGQDLRDPGSVLDMEFKAAKPKPAQFYGGWWFFAFPLAHVKQHPFPFFVRGDDISFSLANKFQFATLSGVVSFQDDFSAKESALNLYLDLRNHLVHHLVFPDMQLGANGTASIALRFIWRSLCRFHYESAEAQLRSVEDVMKGPKFFADNADMKQRRAEINATIQQEKWQPADIGALPPSRTGSPRGGFVNKVLAATVNGHLIPFYSRIFGDKISVPVDHRGLLHPLWGASEISFYDPINSKAYTVKQSKSRGLGILWRTFRLLMKFRRAYPRLVQEYRKGYPEIAAPTYWQGQFHPEEPAKDAA